MELQIFLKHQQQRIVEAIDYYVKKNQLKLEVRFDIISLLKAAGALKSSISKMLSITF
ncbi:MAG: hypothetical protein VXZ57_07185 [Bacteroidota bacterium]|nr:hypothetical protein [Bacteroidota bacterium]